MRPFDPPFALMLMIRRLRGWLYRRVWGGSRNSHRQRRKGFERRCGAEEQGRTMEHWVAFLRRHGLVPPDQAVLVELAAGDGLIGSIGVWLERQGTGVRCFLWEHRPLPIHDAVRQRSGARVTQGRLVDWRAAGLAVKPWLVTSGCSRQTAHCWQAIRQGLIRPHWLVIWNPTERPVWWRRARREGYRLRWVHHNREYYQSL
jgi:hypothetical protein